MAKKIVEVKQIDADHTITEKTNFDNYQTVASGSTYKDALQGLVAAINGDYVDTENCCLHVIETNP